MNDFAVLAADADLADAGYVEGDPASGAAFKALGYTLVARYEDPTHQWAIVSNDATGEIVFVQSGSRVSGKSRLEAAADVFEDMETTAVSASGPAMHAGLGCKGAFNRAASTMAMAYDRLAGQRVAFVGHSLGGSVVFAPCFVPVSNIIRISRFSSPKWADVDYHAALAGMGIEHNVAIYGNDLWSGYPWGWAAEPVAADDRIARPARAGTPWAHTAGAAIDHLLSGGGWKLTDEAGLPHMWNPNDHDITGRVRPALHALAGTVCPKIPGIDDG